MNAYTSEGRKRKSKYSDVFIVIKCVDDIDDDHACANKIFSERRFCDKNVKRAEAMLRFAMYTELGFSRGGRDKIDYPKYFYKNYIICYISSM